MTSNSNIFLTRTSKAILTSLLFTYVTLILLSLQSILNLTFDLYSILFVPVVLAAITSFFIVASRKYIRTNVPSKNRFFYVVKGLSVQTVSLAALCSVSAWVLCSLNPFFHDEKVWHLHKVGCAIAGGLFHYENIYFEEDFHFPIIQTTKYSMFMANLSVIVFKSMNKSFVYVFFTFIPLYSIEPKLCTDIYFFVTLWCSIFLVLYLFHSFEYILYLTLTERIVFPIVTIKDDSNSLLNALNTDNKIIKSLALYDLYQTTIKDAKRRKDIFSLSFVGNVPQSWKIIFNYCINNIKSTTEDMTNIVKHVSPKLIIRRNIPNARLIQTNGGSISNPNEEIVNKQKFFEKFHTYNYLFGPLDKQKTLEEFEVTVWCCYILSNLAVVSLKEDEYGVVREQLGEIISTILDLKNKLELQRRNFDSQKSKNIEYFKTHIKTCAVMLALNFAMYANDIGLDENQLHSFKKIIIS